MLDIFRGLVYGQPVTPRSVQVVVGTPASSAESADDITAALSKQGFDSDAGTGSSKTNTPPKSSSTVIRYGTRGRVGAALLARWLDASVTFSFDSQLQGARLLLSPGADFKGVRTSALPESAVQAPSLSQSTTTTTAPFGTKGRVASTTTTTGAGKATSSTLAHGATTTSVPDRSTTTTTVVGVVPVQTDQSAKCT
jgi:hypothetical protein